MVKQPASRRPAEPAASVSVATSLAIDKSVLRRPASEGAFGERLAQNTPTGRITAPLLPAQGGTDPLVALGAGRVREGWLHGRPEDGLPAAHQNGVEFQGACGVENMASALASAPGVSSSTSPEIRSEFRVCAPR